MIFTGRRFSSCIFSVKAIEKQAVKFQRPVVYDIARDRTPYRILVSCILSLRTKDKITDQVSKKLFEIADTPGEMIKQPLAKLMRLIRPVGFYRNKAKTILQASGKIIKEFSGVVPSNRQDLLSIKGVGRKTANLVLGLGYNIPAICVDTHVHRISNRIGWVNTQTPYQTEELLMGILPESYWIKINTILVAFGQNICVPVSPFCSRCPVVEYCERAGVKKSR